MRDEVKTGEGGGGRSAIAGFFKRIRTRSKSPAAAVSPSTRLSRKPQSTKEAVSTRTPSRTARLRHCFSTKVNSKEANGTRPEAQEEPLTELRRQSQRAALSEQDLVSKTLSAQLSEPSEGVAKTGTGLPSSMLSSTYSQSQDCILDNVRPHVPSYLRISCALNGYHNAARLPLSTGLEPGTSTDSPRLPPSLVERRLETFNSPSTRPSAPPPPVPIEGTPSVKERASSLNANGGPLPPKPHPRRPALSPPPLPSQEPFPPPPPALNGVNGSLAQEVIDAVDSQPLPNGHHAPNSANGSGVTGESMKRQADEARERLRVLCEEADGYLQQGLPDDAENLVRVAFGKANLLMGKKFNKFYDLIDKNLNPVAGDPQPTLVGDLEGYWSIVVMEMEDIDEAFATVHRLKAANWDVGAADLAPSASPAPPRTPSSGSPSPRGNQARKTPPGPRKTPASGTTSDARKRLLQAKAAGRKKMADAEANQDTILS